MKFVYVLVFSLIAFSSFAGNSIQPFAGVGWKDSLQEVATKLIKKGYKVGITVPRGRKKLKMIKKGSKANSVLESHLLSTLGKKKDQKLNMFFHKYKDVKGKTKYSPQGDIYLVIKDVNLKGAIYDIKYKFSTSFGVLLKISKNVITLRSDSRIKLPLILTEVNLILKKGDDKPLCKSLLKKYKFQSKYCDQNYAIGKVAKIEYLGGNVNYQLGEGTLNALQKYYEEHKTKLKMKSKKDASDDI